MKSQKQTEEGYVHRSVKRQKAKPEIKREKEAIPRVKKKEKWQGIREMLVFPSQQAPTPR